MSFYEATHRLAHLIKHTEMVTGSQAVVQALVERHAKPGDKSLPIDVSTNEV
jgi:hypothetical protein